ncbi:uncharacterized protein N7446_012135 [Penicillium canescens]|uniref:endo-polygalacturonase n=1 Tax=Penicillium canescens TaxID=5083 RepID=A0AAD6I8B1_PENCN|nr:uncharacterized protein N7446_012135 [Penicillium canescens]KAJ6037857.1 hypothetical protein N7460_007628 [Penicillium canescens]KAJ6045271.1 hypothetical protein N7446_012135 [Penicillium canescens]KAJ6060972.1 hypothetical protein N7444_001668 [Penicillium canescens]
MSRSSFKEPLSATRNGKVRWSRFPEHPSPSREPPEPHSTEMVPAGGMERELTAARRSLSSSTAHKLTNSIIENIYIKNSPVQVFSINGATELSLSGITVDNADGDSKGGHKTDAFDVGSRNGVYITNPTVHNQDDCPAVNSGTNVHFTGAKCTGGHGISIGSDSQNGVRIKTVYGATSSVKGVTYKDITLSGITKYGVVIEQDYQNGSPTGTPTNGVPITGLTMSNVKGTVSSSATDVYILCASGACSNWSWSGVSVTGGKTSSKFKNIPSGASC